MMNDGAKTAAAVAERPQDGAPPAKAPARKRTMVGDATPTARIPLPPTSAARKADAAIDAILARRTGKRLAQVEQYRALLVRIADAPEGLTPDDTDSLASLVDELRIPKHAIRDAIEGVTRIRAAEAKLPALEAACEKHRDPTVIAEEVRQLYAKLDEFADSIENQVRDRRAETVRAEQDRATLARARHEMVLGERAFESALTATSSIRSSTIDA